MFKVLTKECEPKRGSKYSACVDLYASEDCMIGAGETKLVGLGVCIDLEKLEKSLGFHTEYYNDEALGTFLYSHYLQLMLRSSLGKKGLILPNNVGVIDLDYKDEIKMIIHNPIVTITKDLELLGAEEYNEMGCGLNWEYKIKKGDKIGQITLLEHKSYLFGIESDVERNGGFGSTDKEEKL